MKTEFHAVDLVSRGEVEHLLDDKFRRAHGIDSWEGRGYGTRYKTVELTHRQPLSDGALTKLAELGLKMAPR
jgi:hypothetical protein